jgi:hypothetical protein
MTKSKFMAAALLAAALAVPGSAQSASELLQKGIYSQETAGDLDGAIQIYRQIVGSSPAQHEIAAEAQYRLAQALVRKGDLTGAALEFQKLARDYSEYQALISRMAATPGITFTPAAATPPASTEFDLSTSVNVTGTVTRLLWVNPRSWLHVKDGIGTDWNIAMASPLQMTKQQFTKDTLKTGDQVTVNVSLSKDGSRTALAGTITSSSGAVLFDRAKVQTSTETAAQPAITFTPDGPYLRASVPEAYNPSAYIVRPNDVLFVDVHGQPDYTWPVGVRPDGKITVPKVGDLQAGGLTTNQLRDQLTKALSSYVVDPMVNVMVVQANSQIHIAR